MSLAGRAVALANDAADGVHGGDDRAKADSEPDGEGDDPRDTSADTCVIVCVPICWRKRAQKVGRPRRRGRDLFGISFDLYPCKVPPHF